MRPLLRLRDSVTAALRTAASAKFSIQSYHEPAALASHGARRLVSSTAPSALGEQLPEASTAVPSAVELLAAARNLPADLFPARVSGVVHKAKLSGLGRARLRKAALIAAGEAARARGLMSSSGGGTELQQLPVLVGWNPAWDRPRMSGVMKPPKGHAHEKLVVERCARTRHASIAHPGISLCLWIAAKMWIGRSCFSLLWRCRLDKIAANLAAQPKKRADYKKTLPPKPLKQGLLQWIKKSACGWPVCVFY